VTLVMALGAAGLATSGSAGADVTGVTGSAYGYRAHNITLFGGVQPDTGPTPTVTLAPDGSSSPQSARAATGLVQYGPATLFTSDGIDVTTAAILGPSGSVTSSTNVQNVNKAATQSTTGSEILTADVAGTCTASESGTSGSTTITNGTLQTDSGLDLNDDGDFTDSGEHPPVDQPIPTNPAPNTAYEGHIHLSATSYDNFRVVFNEQLPNADGSLTVNPVQEYFLGPTLTGRLVIGQAVCGVTVTQTTTTTQATTTTTAPTTTTLPTTPTTTPTVPPVGLTQFCRDVPILSYTQPFLPPPPGISPHPNPSSPYPSSISVAGLTGTVTDVNVTLRGFQTRTQTWAEDTDVLLAGPNGANAILMADAGGDNNTSSGQVVDADLTLDDEAATELPADALLTTGTYRPVDDDVDAAGDAQPDSWMAPAPPLTDTTLLSTFDGLEPNGTWNLFVVDDQWMAENDFLGGWCIDITTAPTPPVPPRRPPVADFDGDGDSDVSVFRPSSGAWFVRGATPEATTYGADGDIAVPADYDGDAKTDVAVYRPSVGTWYVHNSATGTDTLLNYGVGSDIAVPADYDGDAKADVALFRPDSATWYVRNSATGTDTALTYGIAGDIPVPGYYDGDNRADMAIFRPSEGGWYFRNSATGASTSTTYGVNGDVPTPGDFDRDGRTDVAVYRPSVGTWYVNSSATGTDTLLNYGVGSDVPQVGDYDNDAKADIAVFRPDSATWYVRNSATGTDTIVTYGIPGDVPLPMPHAIRRFFY